MNPIKKYIDLCPECRGKDSEKCSTCDHTGYVVTDRGHQFLSWLEVSYDKQYRQTNVTNESPK